MTNSVYVTNFGLQSINLVGNGTIPLAFSGPWTMGTNIFTIGAGPTGAEAVISGPISGSGQLVRGDGNVGELLLTATNTFTGAVVASNGVLGLGGTGAISNASALYIYPGATFDVSALTSTTYYLSSPTTLYASGTGTSVGTTAAAINATNTGVINLGSQPLNLTFDGTDPALYISQGALTLNGNFITVNPVNGGLGAGTYTLVNVVGGTINGTPNPNVAVTGSGLNYACVATAQVTNGSVVLVVTQGNSDYWTGSDFANSPDWSDGTNWASLTPPNLFGDAVDFTGSTGPTPVMNKSYSVFSLMFDGGAGAFTLTASSTNVLTVSDGLTNGSPNTQTLNLPIQMVDYGQNGPTQWNINNPVVVNGVVSDAGTGMAVSGTSTLSLNAANTYTGGTVVSNGGTIIANTIADSPSSIGPSGTFTFNGGELSYTGSANATTGRLFNAVTGSSSTFDVSGTGSVTLTDRLTGSGAFTINKTSGGTLVFANTADDSFTGVNIVSGTLILATASTSGIHGLGTASSIGSGATLKLAGSGGFNIYSGVNITNISGGLFDLNGQNDSFAALFLSGTGISGSGAVINSFQHAFLHHEQRRY